MVFSGQRLQSKPFRAMKRKQREWDSEDDYSSDSDSEPEGKYPAQGANQVYVHAWTWNHSDKICSLDEFKTKHKDLCDSLRVIIGPKGQFIFQLEQGEQGNYHYQGYLRLTTKRRSHTLGAELGTVFPGIWVSPAVTGQSENLRRYCMKEDSTYRAGPWADKPINRAFGKTYEGKGLPDKLYPWQQHIVDSVKQACNDTRTVNWVYDDQGGKGKSTLAKYIAHHRLGFTFTILTSNGVAFMVIKRGSAPCYIFDIPRTKSKKISMDEVYSVLEQVKNGHVISDKYDGGELLMDHPHVWVFSNYLPNLSKMSRDRFKIWCVKDDGTLGPHVGKKKETTDEELLSLGLDQLPAQ